MDMSPRACQMCGKMWTPTTRYQATRNKTCSPACTRRSISRTMRNRPMSRRVEWVTLACSVCGKRFERTPSWAKRTREPMCSYRCNGVRRGQEWAKHAHKGRAGWTDASRESARLKMTGPNNPAWKGGVTLKRAKGNYRGVRYVRAPQWAVPMARKDGYIMEHRLVVAEWCGRLLTRTEVVNHRDHDPSNNQRSNLELWPTNRDHKLAEFGRYVPGVHNRVSLAA